MTTEPLSPKSMRELVSAAGPCITIVAGPEPASFQQMIAEVREQLHTRKIEPNALLAPILESAPGLFDGNPRRSAVILRSPDVFTVMEAAPNMQPTATVADRFSVRALLSISASQRTFFILALSQNRTRLLQCTDQSSQEVPFPEGTPASLAEAMQTRKPDHVLDNRASGGPSTGSMKGVMFGTSTDREDKDQYLLHFFSEIDKAVNAVLKGRNDFVIPVAVEYELAIYKAVNTCTKLVEPGIHGAPDGMEGGEMHRRALALLDSHALQLRPEALSDFDKKVGTGHASTHVQDIVAAAYEGRVSHLFLQEDAKYLGSFDAVRQIVKHANSSLETAEDLIESAALQTILHGGDARILPASAMPNGVPVCAIYRYAALAGVPAGTTESPVLQSEPANS